MSPIPPPPKPPRFLFFDFDGTLAETLTDLHLSVNHTLRELGLPGRSREEVRLFVGEGVHVLMRRSVGEEHLDLHAKSLEIFGAHYDDHLLDNTRLLPGVEECLETFRDADLAILSNKPEPFTRKIAGALGLAPRFPLILGPSSPEERKPRPWMMERALEHFGRSPGEGLLVGDTPVDVETGRNAGVHTVAVLGGFRTREELESSDPDRIVESLHELIRLYA